MKHLLLALFLTSFLLTAAIGRSAEPPITCRLELVRLEPLPPGKAYPENEQLWRFVRGQYLRRSVTDNVVDEYPRQLEKQFREVVHKEPEKYQTQSPFRAVVTLGGRKYGFVLDKQTGKSPGYDRLYFDLNGNGDLTDDAPIDVPERDKTPDSIKSEGGYVTASYLFPTVDLRIQADGTEWDYSFFLYPSTTTHEKDIKNISVGVRLVPAVYRRGEIMLAGERRRISLVDWNVSGRFDVPVEFASDGKGIEDFLAQYGTEILFDPEMLIDRHLESGYMSEHRQFLAKMNALGGRLYAIRVRPGGDELTCTPVAVPVGKITTPHAPCNVWLISEQGLLALDLQKDSPAELPAGVWRLLYYTLWRNDDKGRTAEHGHAENKSLKNADGEPIKDAATPENAASRTPKIMYVGANGGTACAPITVVAGRTTVLNIGPPYTPKLTVEVQKKVAVLGLEIRGVGQEQISDLGGSRPPPPKFTISDPQGKVVEQGNFEYG